MWHTNLPQYLSDKIEHVQRRAFRIIYPEYSYNEALRSAKCFPLKERRQILCLSIFRKIQEPSSRLHCLLPRADMHERSDKPCPCTCHIHVYVLQNFMVLSHPHKFKSTNFLRCRLYNVTSSPLQLALAAVCRPGLYIIESKIFQATILKLLMRLNAYICMFPSILLVTRFVRKLV